MSSVFGLAAPDVSLPLVLGLAAPDVSLPLVPGLAAPVFVLVLVFWLTFVFVLVVSLEPDVEGLALGLSVVVAAPCALSVDCVPEPTFVDELWFVVVV